MLHLPLRLEGPSARCEISSLTPTCCRPLRLAIVICFHVFEKFSMASVGLEIGKDTGGSCSRSFCNSTAFVSGAPFPALIPRFDASGLFFPVLPPKRTVSALLGLHVFSPLSLAVSSFAFASSLLQRISAAFLYHTIHDRI